MFKPEGSANTVARPIDPALIRFAQALARIQAAEDHERRILERRQRIEREKFEHESMESGGIISAIANIAWQSAIDLWQRNSSL